MCLSLALGIASTAASMVSAAESSARQTEMYQSNALNANQDAEEKYAQNQMQQIQEEAKAAQSRINTKASVVQAKGTALAGSANEGSSVNSVLNDLERQGAKNDNVTDINARNAKIQANANNTSIGNEAQGRIDSLTPGSDASVVGAAIAGLTGVYTEYKDDNKTYQDTGGTGVSTSGVGKKVKP